MQMRRRISVVISAALFLLTAPAFAQDSDSPSLGDLARQQREQHAKTTQAKDGKTPKVFTNADLPTHSDGSAPAAPAASDMGKAPLPVPPGGLAQGSEQMRSEIQAQKSQIAELQRQIDEVNGSIRFAPGNCVRGCEKWNEHQQEKQQQVEQMQTQLEEQKRHLDEMQESARKQGFGSSVYDP
jgi:peptidoglycan hydrolase CwlO-like protein